MLMRLRLCELGVNYLPYWTSTRSVVMMRTLEGFDKGVKIPTKKIIKGKPQKIYHSRVDPKKIYGRHSYQMKKIDEENYLKIKASYNEYEKFAVSKKEFDRNTSKQVPAVTEIDRKELIGCSVQTKGIVTFDKFRLYEFTMPEYYFDTLSGKWLMDLKTGMKQFNVQNYSDKFPPHSYLILGMLKYEATELSDVEDGPQLTINKYRTTSMKPDKIDIIMEGKILLAMLIGKKTIADAIFFDGQILICDEDNRKNPSKRPDYTNTKFVALFANKKLQEYENIRPRTNYHVYRSIEKLKFKESNINVAAEFKIDLLRNKEDNGYSKNDIFSTFTQTFHITVPEAGEEEASLGKESLLEYMHKNNKSFANDLKNFALKLKLQGVESSIIGMINGEYKLVNAAKYTFDDLIEFLKKMALNEEVKAIECGMNNLESMLVELKQFINDPNAAYKIFIEKNSIKIGKFKMNKGTVFEEVRSRVLAEIWKQWRSEKQLYKAVLKDFTRYAIPSNDSKNKEQNRNLINRKMRKNLAMLLFKRNRKNLCRTAMDLGEKMNALNKFNMSRKFWVQMKMNDLRDEKQIEKARTYLIEVKLGKGKDFIDKIEKNIGKERYNQSDKEDIANDEDLSVEKFDVDEMKDEFEDQKEFEQYRQQWNEILNEQLIRGEKETFNERNFQKELKIK